MHQPIVGGSRLCRPQRVPCHGMQATPLTLMVGRYRADSGRRDGFDRGVWDMPGIAILMGMS